MVNVKYLIKDDFITLVEVSGHAKFDEYGSDIVCAGISTLCYAIGNKLLNVDKNFDLTILENEFLFKNSKKDETKQLLLETLLEGLMMVEEQYKDNIQIKEVQHD